MSDEWGSLISRHGLTSAEAVRIRDEVETGHAFTEPHLRAAAAEWARHRLEKEGIAQLWGTRWRRALLVAALVVLAGEVVWKLSTLPARRSVAGLWLAAGLLALQVLAWWNRRRLLRATITGNEGPRP